MANTSFKFPVISSEKDSNGNITNIEYQLFLPQNNLQSFSSSYIKKNQEINKYKTPKPLINNTTIYTKYDMGVSASSYLKYKLKYFKHTHQNKSSYTNFILGNNKSFTIHIIDGGKNYNKSSYKIKIMTNNNSNQKTCWLCNSLDNTACNGDCSNILDIPIYANTYNGKITSIDIFPYYIVNNKLVDNTKLLYKTLYNLTLVIPSPDTDITNSMASLSFINVNDKSLAKTKLEVSRTINQETQFDKIIPREAGLNSSTELNYRKKHSHDDFNVFVKKIHKKIRRFLYKQSVAKQKFQENYSIPNKIDNNNFNPRIRFKKSKQLFVINNSSNSLRGLSQSSLLAINTNNVIDTTRQININYSIPSSQYLHETVLENKKRKNKKKSSSVGITDAPSGIRPMWI